LLFQGSIEKSAMGPIDWEDFATRFHTGLAKIAAVEAVPTPWPDLQEDEVSGLVEQYSTAEWNEYR
jgi:lipoate-protein ligase A